MTSTRCGAGFAVRCAARGRANGNAPPKTPTFVGLRDSMPRGVFRVQYDVRPCGATTMSSCTSPKFSRWAVHRGETLPLLFTLRRFFLSKKRRSTCRFFIFRILMRRSFAKFGSCSLRPTGRFEVPAIPVLCVTLRRFTPYAWG
jgi:hypothetical protein